MLGLKPGRIFLQIEAQVQTELTPLGAFATRQAERAIGDHDRNTLRLQLDAQRDLTGFESGMTVWLDR